MDRVEEMIREAKKIDMIFFEEGLPPGTKIAWASPLGPTLAQFKTLIKYVESDVDYVFIDELLTADEILYFTRELGIRYVVVSPSLLPLPEIAKLARHEDLVVLWDGMVPLHICHGADECPEYDRERDELVRFDCWVGRDVEHRIRELEERFGERFRRRIMRYYHYRFTGFKRIYNITLNHYVAGQGSNKNS